ncbi:hypothetical protein C8D95_105330 [Silicimonas algicola]|uniref:Uncharacterized protein n=1 Tax=Silicimonas algicola TaxID=1826607 RepID=A0A316G6L8_9RHOB|nr:hypothetical protein C8D95_105330 [Silicimonas algicola]
MAHFLMGRDGEKIDVEPDVLTPFALKVVLKRIMNGISIRFRR